jgi:peptidoglycan/xylan/chitin deacetylase (PgdA/CDA1 family)
VTSPLPTRHRQFVFLVTALTAGLIGAYCSSTGPVPSPAIAHTAAAAETSALPISLEAVTSTAENDRTISAQKLQIVRNDGENAFCPSWFASYQAAPGAEPFVVALRLSPDTSQLPDSPQPSPSPQPPETDCRKMSCVALTFDDGPSPYTSQLLATLAQYDAHATFFVIGQNVVTSPSTVQAEITAGHEVGNHSWSHPNLTRLGRADLTHQIDRTDTAVQNASGQRPTLIRPPFGAVNQAVRSAADRPLILWSVDTLDWKYRSVSHVAKTVIDSVHPGDIVLMHDSRPTTVQAIPQILAELSSRGYHFVTVSELEQDVALQAGQTYRYGARPTPDRN